MLRAHFVLPFALLASVCHAQLASSYFDSSLEGWSGISDATPSWSTIGNPAGSFQLVDHNVGQWYYWSASASFLGNKAAAYDGRLLFDMWQNRTPDSDTTPDVLLISPAMTLAYNFTPPPNSVWTSFNVPLTAASWRITDLSGAVPTPLEMQAVLSNLTGIHIRGEFTSSVDTSRLDNVRLHAGIEIPVSGTVTLLDWMPDEAGYPVIAEVLVNNVVVESHPITLGASGFYTFTCNTQGTIQIRIRDNGHFLSRKSAPITTLITMPITYSPALPNGDSDISGEVDAADIDKVIIFFGTVPGPGFDANADLDGSLEVDAADIDIAIAHFGSVDE